jgi:putative adhesin
MTRGSLITALVAIEFAIVGEAAVALHAGQPAPSSAQHTAAQTASGPHLVEGGPHQIFDAGAHPALTVDIGNADLTILTSKKPQVDVSVSASTAYGILRAKAPITAREDHETIRIATTEGRRWSVGDNRMVTVVVPPETRVTVVNAGDIRANGLRSEAAFNSTGAGSITVEDYDAPALRVASSNGRISMHQIVAARVDATSSDGRVEGTALQVRDGSIESNGPVTLEFATGADTLVSANTDNGRVSVAGFLAAASVASGSNSGEDGADGSSSRTVRVGAGNGRLDVHSSDGNINLARG